MTEAASEKGSSAPQRMFWACLATGDLAGVRQALELGADPDLSPKDRQPALAWATQDPWVKSGERGKSVVELVQLLLDFGADPNLRTKNIPERWIGGRAPLFLMARNNDVPSAKALLKAGADVRAAVCAYRSDGRPDSGNQGLTALHTACATGNSDEMVTLLLEHGADIDARDDCGNSAWDAAKTNCNQGAIRILRASKERLVLRRAAGVAEDERIGATPAQDPERGRLGHPRRL